MSVHHKKNHIGKLVGRTLDHFFSGLSMVSKHSPLGNLERYNIEVLSNIAYGNRGIDNYLDIYLPKKHMEAQKKRPVVFYIHGGAFCTMSKDTHWVMGRNFARAGYLVVNINYRLAPKHPYPAGLEDVCEAWNWVYHNIASFGGDRDRVIVAGESAGANLTLALALACVLPREEVFAKNIYDLQFVPKAIVPMCGIFEVQNSERFWKPYNPLRFLVYRNILDIQQKYVPENTKISLVSSFIDPLSMIEHLDTSYTLSLPPTFLSVGTWDPLLEDTQRLYEEMIRREQTVEVRYYPREVHAFQALLFRKQARKYWKEMFVFLDRYIQK